MYRMPLLSLNGYNNGYNRTLAYHVDRRLSLKLNYTDQVGSIETDVIQCTSNTTIRDIKKRLPQFFPLRSIDPEQVIPSEFRSDGQRYLISSSDHYKTLDELKIASGSELYFKRLSASSRLKLSLLTVRLVNSEKKVNFEWDESSTTIDALFDLVVKTFGLNSIERERIQLCTILNDVLNKPSNSGKKLVELGLQHYSYVYLYIIKPKSTVMYDQEIYIYVKSNSDDDELLLASPTDSIAHVETRIKSKHKHMTSVFFLDHMHNPIDINDRNRKLSDLGVKSNQIIYAYVQESLQKKQTDVSQSSSSSIINPNTVFVCCRLPDNQSITIQASVTDTVAELTANIAALRENQTMAHFSLWSGSITIDDQQPDKRLADFGIQPGSTIYASVTNIAPTNYTIKTNKTDRTDTTTLNFDSDAKPKGLDNLGNTCFMNSVLQCLVHIEPLTDFFMNVLTQSYSNDRHVNKSNPFNTYGEVTGAYAELLWNLQKSDRNSYSYYDYSLRPTRMKETIGRLEPRFATLDQQDAQEFMTLLLDTIHQEIKQKNNHDRNTIITELFFSSIQSSITCSQCQHVSTTTNPNSILSLPLKPLERTFQVNFIRLNGQNEYDMVPMSVGNRIEHLVHAFFERRYDSRRFSYVTAITTDSEAAADFDTPLSKLSEPAITLIEQDHYTGRLAPLRYENKPNTLKLDECIQEFFSHESLDEPWLCVQDNCKRNVTARKQLQLLTFPRVLIIQLKRFSHENGVRRKLDTFVEYPMDGFDLGKLLKSSEEAVYDLIGVCNHIGSIYCGHYTACARKNPKSKKWYRFNDSYVSTVYYKEEIVSRDAYLLFYLKRQK